ncbi:hypothetical protein [Streptomyces rubiginosohelvolus]|uniref:hypothetical protein n=1 Tax=Streptomyces rubiginosohelvolus TaxID=67362 RepID=UPI0037205B1B
MATFNQQGQVNFGPVHQGETVTVTNNYASAGQQILVRELDRALGQIASLELDEHSRQQATAELEAAGAALQSGNPETANERIGRVQAMGGALAEIAGGFVRGVSGLGGH